MTLDARTWPLPRRNRFGPSSSLDLAGAAQASQTLAPPRSRVFPWVMNMTATSRRTISTPLLIGPAILRKIYFGHGTVSTPPQQTLELGWSPILVTEASVALGTVRPYTVLTELQDPFAVVNVNAGKGLLADTSWNTNIPYNWPLDLLVTEPRFCFTISWINAAVTAEQRSGQLMILEAVNADALSTFLGS